MRRQQARDTRHGGEAADTPRSQEVPPITTRRTRTAGRSERTADTNTTHTTITPTAAATTATGATPHATVTTTGGTTATAPRGRGIANLVRPTTTATATTAASTTTHTTVTTTGSTTASTPSGRDIANLVRPTTTAAATIATRAKLHATPGMTNKVYCTPAAPQGQHDGADRAADASNTDADSTQPSAAKPTPTVEPSITSTDGDPPAAQHTADAHTRHQPRRHDDHYRTFQSHLEDGHTTATPVTQVFTVLPTTTTSTPLSLDMTVRATRQHRRAGDRAVGVVYDTGSGTSFAEEKWLRAIGAKIVKVDAPLIFQGMGSDEQPSSAQHTDRQAEISVSIGEYDATHVVWVVSGSPVRLLIGRDNMSTERGHGVLIDPDPAAPTITFKATSETHAATADHDSNTTTDTYHIRTTTRPTIPGGHFRMVDSFVGPVDTDVYVREQSVAGIHVPDQVVRTNSTGHAPVLLHNQQPGTATLHVGSTISDALPITNTPLSATTSAALAAQRAHAEPAKHTAHATTPARHTAPATAATTTTLFADTKPTSSEQVRRTWDGKQGGDDAPYTDVAAMPANDEELDIVLRNMVDDAEVGDKAQRRRALGILRKVAKLGLWSTTKDKVGDIKDHAVSFKHTTDKPTFVPPYRQTPAREAEILRQAAQQQAEGIISPTTSPYNFPLLLVSKGHGRAPRMCLDMRAFNETLIGEWFQIPNLKDLVSTMAGGSIFTKLDATSGFQMVRLSDDDGPVPSNQQLAFTLPQNKGRFAYNRLTFGVADASHVFQRVMNTVLQEHLGYAVQYIDDTVIYNGDRHTPVEKSVDDHLDKMEAVFTTLAEAGCKLGAHKTQILQTSIEALGHRIRDHTITMDDAKHTAIDGLRTPTTKKELTTAMGLLGMARRFTPGYAAMAAPLEDLLHKAHQAFKWTDTQEHAYQRLKDRFKTTDALMAPDWDRPFEVWCDASNTATGGMLLQRDANGLPGIVEFHSHKLTSTERNYSTPEREALAILLSCKQFRKYLLADNRFKLAIMSDHRGLVYLYRNTDTNSRLYRWADSLSEFNYTIQWVPGTEQRAADAISRLTAWVHATMAVTTATDTDTAATGPHTTTATTITAPTPPHAATCLNTHTYNIERLVTEHKQGQRITYRVRWEGWPPSDDSLEPLAALRQQLTPQALARMRSAFQQRDTQAEDEALTQLPGTPAPRAARPVRSAAETEADNDHMLGRDDRPNTRHETPFTAGVLPQDLLLPELSVDTMITHQQADPHLQRKRAALHAKGKDADERYLEHASGLLLKTYTPTKGPRRQHTLTAIAVPATLIPLVLTATHDAAGHHGETATIFQLQSRFAFPGLTVRARAHVKACDTCGRAKKDNRPVPHGKIPTYQFLHTLGIDFAGPFATSKEGNTYLCIIVDHATKWVHVAPTKSTSAECAGKALIDFAQRYGLPLNIKSDRGSGFMARAWQALLRHMNIRHRPTVAYNPQGDSHAETQVKNVKSIIRAATQRHARDWDQAGRWAAWSYNQSYNTTTGTTPHYACYAREPRHIADHVFNHTYASDGATLSQLVARVRDVHATVQLNVRKMHAKSAHLNHQMRRVRPTPQVGDRVRLHRVYPGTASPITDGLSRAWFWPFRPETYEVTEALSAQHVRIRTEGTGQRPPGKTQVVHVRRLKPLNTTGDPLDITVFSDTSTLDTD